MTLSQLKKLLGNSNLIETTRTAVSFNTAIPHTLDVHQFETLIQKTERHDHASLAQCDVCLADLESAVSLYRGDFLAGLSLAGCAAFDEWQFVWRERLHVLALKQLGRLAEAFLENGRFAQAEAFARRQIEIDTLNEVGHRNLMHALYAQGQPTLALQQYQTCVGLLAAELGIPPEAKTEQLRSDIAQNRLVATRTNDNQPSRPTNLPENLTPFFGREEELTLLSERLHARTYRLISLVGPRGIGKTRLAIEAKSRQQ